ncbi:PEP-CTERM sorting domain-containing protein [Planctomycetota bacterium]
MKNLLMIVLVLALAATASATVSMNVYNVSDGDAVLSNGDTIAIGNVIRVAISDTDPNVPAVGSAGFADFKVNVTAGTFNTGSDVWALGLYSGDPFYVSPWATTPLPASLIGLVIGGGFDAKIDAIFAATPFAPPFPGDMVSFTFTATAETTIDPYYGQYNGDGVNNPAIAGAGDAFGVVNLTLVPEPMTIALLGLGGLFLRRRK